MNKDKEDFRDDKGRVIRSKCPYGGIDCAWCTEECVNE